MFHAVSLEGDVEAAKVLAYSAPRLREGVERVEGAKLELTAVVEPLRDVLARTTRARSGIGLVWRRWSRQEIRVVTVNDLARVAETARMELGVVERQAKSLGICRAWHRRCLCYLARCAFVYGETR